MANIIINPLGPPFDFVDTSGGSSNITITGNDGAPQTSNAFTILGQSGIGFNWNGSEFIIAPTGGGFPWTTVVATPTAMVAQHGYIIGSVGALCVLTFPASPSVGDTIKIINFSIDGFEISQGNTAQIYVGNISTIAGMGHGINGLDIGTSINLVCVSAGGTKIWASDGAPQGDIGFF